MTLDESYSLIGASLNQMNARYGTVVFDEWAVLSLHEKTGRVLNYCGPRREDFTKNFISDLGALRAELTDPRYAVGDFEFARHGVGTKIEAFLVLGQSLYLLCNHTQASMDDITKNPRWLGAQVVFAELSEKIRSNAVRA